MTITSILCAVDFSRESPRLLRTALALAQRARARVTVLHVLDPLLVAAARVEYEEGLLEREADQDLRALILDTANSSGSGVPVTAIERLVRVGRPDEEILAEAAERDADLLVIGTHGCTGVRRVFFGSTAARVLARSSMPVFALPPGALPSGALPPGDREPDDPPAMTPLLPPGAIRAATPDEALPPTRLLVAVDFTESCMKAVREAAVLARRWQLALTLLHAVPAGPSLDRWREFLDADRDRRIEHARYRLQLLAEELSRDRADKQLLAVTVVAEGGSPEDVIARVAAEEPGTLVVMGLRDRGMLTPTPGSTAYRVLCMASTPVLVLPPTAEWPRGLARVHTHAGAGRRHVSTHES